MRGELLVPTALVHERLGITEAPKRVRMGGSKLDVRRLNIKDADSPARGVWIDREATLKFLRMQEQEDVPLTEAIRRLSMLTAGSS